MRWELIFIHIPFSAICTQTRIMCACMQVEFNKAAQSLTDAMIPTTQKKTALNRLVKVASFTKDYISVILFGGGGGGGGGR